MNKRLAIVIAFLLVTVLGLLIWGPSRPRDPVFEGRTLTSWLDHHVASSAASPPYNSPGWKKADQALRSIGTNAIPTLLEMIRAKDPATGGAQVVAGGGTISLDANQLPFCADA